MRSPMQMVQITVTCADISALLFRLNMQGIGIYRVDRKDVLTASFFVRQGQYSGACKLIERTGGKIDHCVPASLLGLMKDVMRRPVLLIGCVLMLVLTLYLPTRVLFVTVSGNERIPTRQILEAAGESGISFGTARREIRSEKVKNRLLSALPELKWVGVNTTGCVAKISVRERTPLVTEDDLTPINNIVASYDGVIRQMTVISGNPVCRVGQAVTKGQLLVSGYSNCGRCIYWTRADAQIYAQTRHTLKLSTLITGLKRAAATGIKQKYGLIVGKKRINFFKGSGICDIICDRMYVEYPLVLPGGFELPVALTVQKEIDYETSTTKTQTQNMEAFLEETAQRYLESQMIAGQVKNGDYQILEEDGALRLIGAFVCDEMIGQIRNEEIKKDYEQTG